MMPVEYQTNLTLPPHSYADAWTEKVLATAEAFISSKAKSPAQHLLLRTSFAGLKHQVANWAPEGQSRSNVLIPFVHLPIFIYAGVKGRIDERVIQLSAATSLLFLGIDIFDDVADGDCPDYWGAYNAGERNLAAATLLSCLPQLLLAELDAPASTIHAMQQTLAEGLLAMSAGQQSDLLSGRNDFLKTKDVIETLSGKSGAEISMFAQMAAQLAGTTAVQIEAFGKMGNAIGVAGQLSSDCYELFSDPECRDLLHGTRTLPIVLYLNSLHASERDSFILLLEQAKKEPTVRDVIKNRIRKSGALSACAMVVENCCQEARKALHLAAPLPVAKESLEAIINDVSFFAIKPNLVTN